MKKDLSRKIFVSSIAFTVISVFFSGVYCFGIAANGLIVSNPLTATSITDFIGTVLSEIVKVGAILCVLALIYVGFLFVKARGNSEEINSAKKALWGTIIGIALLLGAQVIAMIIKGTVDRLTS